MVEHSPKILSNEEKSLQSVGFFFFFSTTVLSKWDFSKGKFGLPSPGKPAATESRYTQPTVYAGCFSVFIIHRTLTGLRDL